MESQNQKKGISENKMGTMSVNKLLINMALPMVVSMLVQALYNIVDSKFVSMISEDALTAVSLAFPVQNLMISIAVGTGVGINALLSKRLGEKNQKEVDKTAYNGVFLAVVSYLLFFVIGIAFSEIFYRMQTDVDYIVTNGAAYVRICSMGSIGLFGQIAYEKLLQSTGRTMYSMLVQLFGAIINIILDPILIFGYFGFPELGVAGAALATVIGQICGFCLGIYLNHKKNPEVNLKFRGVRPNWVTIKQIYVVGIPSIVMASIGSIMTFGINLILLSFTKTAATVFGVYFKLQSFVFMPVFAINNGLVPILAYNFGAGNRKRITKAIKLGIMYAMAIMFIGLLIFQIFPKQLLEMFEASEYMLEIGIPALRIICIHFVFAGFCIIAGSVFQALRRGVLSLIVSVIRQLAILLPVAYLLALTGDLNAVWWSFPIAECASVIFSAFFLRSVYRKVIKKLP